MLEDGVVAAAEDVDLGMILGAGWPFQMGGATPYLDRVGASERAFGDTFHHPVIRGVVLSRHRADSEDREFARSPCPTSDQRVEAWTSSPTTASPSSSRGERELAQRAERARVALERAEAPVVRRDGDRLAGVRPLAPRTDVRTAVPPAMEWRHGVRRVTAR